MRVQGAMRMPNMKVLNNQGIQDDGGDAGQVPFAVDIFYDGPRRARLSAAHHSGGGHGDLFHGVGGAFPCQAHRLLGWITGIHTPTNITDWPAHRCD